MEGFTAQREMNLLSLAEKFVTKRQLRHYESPTKASPKSALALATSALIEQLW
jgi:hypothetical protein